MPSRTSKSRETEPAALGKDKKDKSRDALANMEARLAMVDTRDGVDLIEQGMKKGLKNLREQIQDLYGDLAIYETAMSARVMATHEAPRVEMPKPHTFSGKRDAKELDNFLWHMKRKHSVQDLDMAMTVAKSLVEYKKGDSSKPKPQSKGNHAKSRRDKGSRGYISKE
ncbi:hypothetical protein CK203_058188 [Vitis vinifera]|uniref:Uncharacterized protein n=1 Tax=Vitis vinifera TaxID=29760 RepID=A0A438GQC1_VITVI|nr:hypothetical protein CK203_058188 [Vitis vinifera]